MNAAAAAIPLRDIARDAAVRQNCVTVRLLALCPMLAVSVSTQAAITLGLLTMAVMTAAGAVVAAARAQVPTIVRIPVFLIIVAALVTVCDILTEALAPAVHRQIGIFLPLIITNCAVLARLEMFASRQAPLAAATDGAATGAGMLAALTLLSLARELLGAGTIADIWTIPHFPGLPSALLPVGGFILFAFLLVLCRRLKIAAPS